MEKCWSLLKARAFLYWKHPCWSVTKKDRLKGAEELTRQVISEFPSHLPLLPWEECTSSPFPVCQRAVICVTFLALSSIPCVCHESMWIHTLSEYTNIAQYSIYIYIHVYHIEYNMVYSECPRSDMPGEIYTRASLSGAGSWCCWRLCHPRKAQARDSAHRLFTLTCRIKSLVAVFNVLSIEDGFGIYFPLAQQYFI